ncbi:ATP-binding protein [Maribellus sediminis]|uniref:ATP-binding protein n=1 Tax=Maribellus sediminis TaxID=2696285 RepID=UPI0014321648|nr:ATP-binding protein [Maribellus sediminis]
MGHLYGATNNPDKQISNYLKSKEIAESIQEKGIITAINMNLGSTYLKLNKLDTALFYAQTALDAYAKNDIGIYSGYIYDLAGTIYQKKGDIDQAMNAFKTALKIHTEKNNLNGLSNSYTDLSSLYIILNKPDSSLFFAQKGLETSNGAGSSRLLEDVYSALSSAYTKLNKNDSALVYLQLASSLRDSMNAVEIKNLTAYQNLSFDEQIRLRELEEEKASFQYRIRTNALMGGLFTLLIVAFLLYRNNKQKQKANIKLKAQKEEIQTTLEQLEATQTQLIQSEKMASLGELTAGIAHEIQNPLNFVNNFSELNSELIDELKEELAAGNNQSANEIANNIKDNEQKIIHHGKRAESIVRGMLLHSRGSSGQKEPTDINALCDEYLRLSYHGFRAKDKSFNADFKLEADESLPKIGVVPQDIGRVLLNLINNAFFAVNEKSKLQASGYKPQVIVSTKRDGNRVEIRVIDNGPGIPDSIKEKIFQPFFTTKPTGQGTGLGLSLSYDIVKAHGGTLEITSADKNGTEFSINLPIQS